MIGPVSDPHMLTNYIFQPRITFLEMRHTNFVSSIRQTAPQPFSCTKITCFPNLKIKSSKITFTFFLSYFQVFIFSNGWKQNVPVKPCDQQKEDCHILCSTACSTTCSITGSTKCPTKHSDYSALCMSAEHCTYGVHMLSDLLSNMLSSMLSNMVSRMRCPLVTPHKD